LSLCAGRARVAGNPPATEVAPSCRSRRSSRDANRGFLARFFL